MQRPELAYPYLSVGPDLHDVLLVPLAPKGQQPEGTIWAVMHNAERKFDLRDAEALQRVAEVSLGILKGRSV